MVGSAFTAVHDACVLYPAPLRDLLMHLALTDLFRARWTADIHAERIAAVGVIAQTSSCSNWNEHAN